MWLATGFCNILLGMICFVWPGRPNKKIIYLRMSAAKKDCACLQIQPMLNKLCVCAQHTQLRLVNYMSELTGLSMASRATLINKLINLNKIKYIYQNME